jgi:hypothetical protein
VHLFLLLLSFFSYFNVTSGEPNKHLTQQPSQQFTFNIQHGGSPFDKSENRGVIDYPAFLSAFDHYPWLDEIDKANADQNSSAPTLTVEYRASMKDLWVAMSGDRKDNGYLVGYAHYKMINGRSVKWLEIYLPDDKQKVKALFGMFFRKEFDSLEMELSKLEKFREMESKH